MTDLAILAAVVAVIAVATWFLRAREGKVRAPRADASRLTTDQRALLAAPDGGLLLMLSAPACHTCAAALDVLWSTAEARSDWNVVTADVGDHLDLARTHNVLRAPTTLVVDAAGVVRHIIGGIPDTQRLAELLDDADVARAA